MIKPRRAIRITWIFFFEWGACSVIAAEIKRLFVWLYDKCLFFFVIKDTIFLVKLCSLIDFIIKSDNTFFYLFSLFFCHVNVSISWRRKLISARKLELWTSFKFSSVSKSLFTCFLFVSKVYFDRFICTIKLYKK